MSRGKQKQEWHYSRLEDEMTTSEAWMSLSGNAIKVFIEFHRFGRSGSTFYKTYKDMKKTFGFSSDTCKRAIDELLKYGFIDMVSKGGITRKEINADGFTCWNKSTYKLSGRWRQVGIPYTRNQS